MNTDFAQKMLDAIRAVAELPESDIKDTLLRNLCDTLAAMNHPPMMVEQKGVGHDM